MVNQNYNNFGLRIAETISRWIPDSFLFTIILTLIAALGAIFIQGSNLFELLKHWYNGMWSILTFAAQLSITLVLSTVVGKTPAVLKILKIIASIPKTPSQAVIFNSVVMGLLSWINWSVGLIWGPIIAVETAKRVRGVDYRILISAVYAGFVIFPFGISSTMSLLTASPGHIYEKLIGVIPLSNTIFIWQNLVLLVIVIICSAIFWAVIHPKTDENIVEIDRDIYARIESEEKASATQEKPTTPAQFIEQSRVLSLIIGVAGAIFLIRYFMGGGSLTFNSFIFIMLVLGLLLAKSPYQYFNGCTSSLGDVKGGVAGILVQFPLYAGIMGIMSGSGLTETISKWFVAISTQATYPLFAYLSSCVVNLFIPSDGGQWMVQGAIMLKAGAEIGTPHAHTILALSYGSSITNMIQPFWFLPILAIAGTGGMLKTKDVIGFCSIYMFVILIITSIWLLVVFK